MPVKYLGVPLISSRLTKADCSVLKDKVLSRIHSWTQKFLSYWERAQLIQLVLFSIQTYWSSIFTLPQKVIQEIEGVLSAFLWSGTELKHSRAKIRWKDLCVPKNGGGLEFRLLKEWNKAINMKHLWALSQKADTLWVKWVHMYILKGYSLKGIQIPSDVSWVMGKLLKLQGLCQGWIRYIIGNGEETFLWTDNWHALGALYQKFGEVLVVIRGQVLKTKVAAIIDQDSWRWPNQRNRAV